MSILVDALEDAQDVSDDYYVRRASVPIRRMNKQPKSYLHSSEDTILIPLPALESDPIDMLDALPDLSEDIFSTSEEYIEPSEMPTNMYFDEIRDRRKRTRGIGSLEISRGQFDSIGMGSLGLPSLPRDSDLEMDHHLEYELPESHTDLPTLPSLSLFASNVPLPVHKCRVCEKELADLPSVFIHGFYYHSECLKCKKCETNLTSSQCVSYKNDLYCNSCCSAKHGCRCGVCSCSIDPCDERVRISRGRFIHRSCLVCYSCSCELSPDNYVLVENQIMCQGCAAEARTRLCKICNRIVLSDGIKRYGKWFHKEHFVCHVCWQVLKGDLFVTHHGKFYCMEHGHIFRHSCEHCKGLIDDPEIPQVTWNRMLYHPECLICRVCGTDLRPSTAKKFHNRPHCAECYKLRLNERERGCDSHKHNPVASASRRANFQRQGIVIVEEPRYAVRKDAQKMVSVKRRNANDGKEFEPSVDPLELLLP